MATTTETPRELHRRRARRPARARPNRSSTRPPARSWRGRRVSSAEDVDRAVQAARRAFDGWSQTTPAQRAQALLALARPIEEHGEEIARLEALNAGKPIAAVTSDELPVMADNLRFFAGAARCLEGRAAGEYMEGYTSFTRREPVGVIGQITPWNYPLMMAIWKIGPALAAGNTVVLKPAETTPITTLRLAELAARDPAAGRAQRRHRPGRADGRGADQPSGRGHGLADRLGRDGQAHRPHGRGHAQARAPRARRQGAGGRVRRRRRSRARWRRSPAPATTTPARTAPPPRACSPASDVYDDVVAGLAEQAQGLVIGDTLAPETTLGPVNSARQRERVEGFLERRPDARRGRHRRRRARAARASTWSRRSWPGCEQDDEMIQREIFGPGDHRAAVHRRGAGDRVGQRHPLRPRLLGVDARRRPRAARRRRRCASAACGSTTTSRSSRRCPTGASRSPATART